jgi:3-isopropylmalate/(R)-2-methylmalate dehydratase small subunit
VKLKGKVFKYGANVDTDVIIPARYLNVSEPEELAKHCMEDIDTEFISKVQPGEIIMGTTNFGCGSSREHAPYALMKAGAEVIVAESYARIFYRNSVDGGFVVPYESKNKLNDKIKTGDEVKVDIENNTITNLTSSETYDLNPLGDVLPIVSAGGLFKYARQTGMIE